MKKHFYRKIIYTIIVTIFSISSFANAGWPGLWVSYSLKGAFDNFYFLVILSLCIETIVLWKLSKIKLYKSIILTLISNTISALIGLNIGYGLILSDSFFFTRVTTNTTIILILDTLMVLTLSIFFEFVFIRLFWKSGWKKIILTLSISNIITHALGALFLWEQLSKN